jgi:selenocysteine-specific elongation factor
MTSAEAPADEPLHVVATAGHVDHGKSSLIMRLTGIDPDRWEEEKRRGLTIDLGFAWCVLPSGREVGFVDVPGHERFIHNMLAGVGPVRLVLFVVAADEGWRPQSEEHLAILQVLGVHRSVIALTKTDLVDDETRALALEEVRERVAGSPLEQATLVGCSARTGEGIDELRAALDEAVGRAPEPGRGGRPRLFVDRVFPITGAGTVVTGTLTGQCLAVGDEIEVFPTRRRARIRGLQTHKRSIERACPVSRVAINLVGADRAELERGHLIGVPGSWRPTREFEARVTPVRSLQRSLTTRGAYKLHAGSAEVDVRIRLYGATRIEPGGSAFARIRTSAPLVLDLFDRFVLRDAGRRETVAGGEVLDLQPPARAPRDPAARLTRRERASGRALTPLLLDERGAVRIRDAVLLVGDSDAASDPTRVGDWLVNPPLRQRVNDGLVNSLEEFHAKHPLLEGMDLASARSLVADELAACDVADDPGLVDSLLAAIESEGRIARDASTVRLTPHRVTMRGQEAELARLLDAVGGPHSAQPPTVQELENAGCPRALIEAAVRAGLVVRVSPDLVMDPDFVARAEAVTREALEGITVGAFRERLETTRKYALPLLELFDRTGVTRREGDLRFPRNEPS